MKGQVISLDDLAAEARANLSNYAGEENYSGEDLSELHDDFTGTMQNVADGTMNRQFTFTIVNANAAVRTAILVPGLGYNINTPAQGVVKTGAHGSIESASTDLTTAGSPKTIEAFLDFIRRNPAMCRGVKISSTVATQIAQTMVVKKESPFQDLASEIINLDSYQDEYGFKDKMVTVARNIQFDDQTRIELPIAGSSTCTITWFFKEILNPAVTLKRKLGSAPTILYGKVAVNKVSAAPDAKQLGR